MRTFQLRSNGNESRLFEVGADYSAPFYHKPDEFPRIVVEVTAPTWKEALAKALG